MSATSDPDEEAVQMRIKQMREDELVEFLRDSALRLNAAADRLTVLAEGREKDAGQDYARDR